MRELVRTLAESLAAGRTRIVCQVVETKGSTPQKAGAIMVVSPEGGQLGTLGGGCVENEVKMRAIRGIDRPGAELHSFVLDHDYAWADGLICGGKMTFAAETYRGAAAAAYFEAYRKLIDAGQGMIEAVVLDRFHAEHPDVPIGARYLFGPDGRFEKGLPRDEAPEGVVERLPALADRPKPLVRAGVAFLPILPRIRLVITGAGHVGQAVAELAAKVDFDVWIVDDRRQYANPDRFPTAERIVVGPIEEALSSLEITPNTYALIVTRGHGHDQEALGKLAPTSAAYVGLIGSKRKIRMILDGLRELGVAESSLARVSAPVGIDIGSQTVDEIAVSIVAELISTRNLGPGRPKPAPSEIEAESSRE